MKIAVVRNLDSSGIIGVLGQPCTEKYGAAVIRNVVAALESAGHEVLLCEGDKTCLAMLERFMPPEADGRPGGLVFNMAYGIQGEARYTHVPAMLEMAGIPYTGSDPLGHALALDKVITKQLLRDAGIPTPRFAVMRTGRESVDGLRLPLVVKPRHESTSFGLQLIADLGQLPAAVESIVARYRQEALVEEYIDGREICVGLLGNADPRVLPAVEHDFGDRKLRIITWEDKSHASAVEPQKICPAEIGVDLAAELARISAATFRTCMCRDYARVDLRVDAAGTPFVIEINSMAALGPRASFVTAAEAAGMDFKALVLQILEIAWRATR